ncbi:MAG TPA: hypothetical protein VLT51_03390, partial [Anaerolineales bacterium]|nr:hypothetical protein [Anaerolineales bacterium]
ITYGLLQQTPGGALALTITNPLSVPLEITKITVTWNNDKGHTTGDDKTLRLQFINLNGTVFWSGNELGETYSFTPSPSVFLQPKLDSTFTFTFHQTFTNWDNTERITINLSGCESNPITQNQH